MGATKTWGWLPLVALLAAPAVLAQVTLETEVSKVVSTLDGAGRVERQLVPVEEVVPGEELRYTITFRNEGNTPVEAERIVITNPLPDGTVYLPGSAGGEGSTVEYSLDGRNWSPVEPSAGTAPPAASPAPGPGARPGEGAGAADQPPALSATAGGDSASPVRSLRWTYHRELGPGDADSVFFHVRMQ